MKKLYDASEGLSIGKQVIWSLLACVIVICFFGGVYLAGAFLSDYYNDNRGWVITILMAVSGLSLLWFLVCRSFVTRIENKETTPVNELSAGDVEIVGKVKSVGESITSPTGHNCVYYASYWVNKIYTHRGNGESGGSTDISYVLVADNVRNSSFVIADESGEIELDLSDVQYQSVHGLWMNQFKGIKLKNPQRSPIGGIVSSQYEEYNLKAGDNFYYNGAIGEFNYKDKTEISDLPPIIGTANRDKAEISDLPPVILKESEWTLPEISAGTRKWKLEGGIIGNRTEEDIGSSYQKGMNISLVVTIILWVIVIFLLFLPSEIYRILKEIIG
jgi:hypothetical protein